MNACKLFLISIVLSVFSIHSFGQAVESEYKATMPGWLVNLNQAQAESVKTGKPILANFTGSDWCGWCIKLKRDVFVKDEFKTWAKKNVILLEIDFPKRTKLPAAIQKQNAELQQAFSIRGYPTVWVFNMTTDPITKQSAITGLAKTGYAANATAWIKDIEGKIASSGK